MDLEEEGEDLDLDLEEEGEDLDLDLEEEEEGQPQEDIAKELESRHVGRQTHSSPASETHRTTHATALDFHMARAIWSPLTVHE